MPRDFSPIKDLLPALLGRLATETGVASGLKPLWSEVVGEAIARHTRPLRLDKGALHVQVTDASWKRELSAREAELVSRLCHRLGEKAVQHLVFFVAP